MTRTEERARDEGAVSAGGDDELRSALIRVVREGLGDASADVDGLRQLTGGASRETWQVEIVDGAGRRRPLILRRDPPALPRPEGMAREAAALRAANEHQVPVPEVIAAGDGSDGVGAPYIVMSHVEGETIPQRILRDDAFADVRPRLAAQCGRILARIHAIPSEVLDTAPAVDPLADLRTQLDELLDRDQGHPALELGLRWLEERRPASTEERLVHGDFRHGNLIITPDEGIRAVLDWELVHVGDPMEDLGWLCVKVWRFGNPAKPVGGFGDYEELIDAYERESGTRPDLDVIRWWELYGTVWWGIGCIRQADRHLSGATRSVELAAIGRRTCENEYDALRLIEEQWLR
jgi:aminoglycoside phosphotransferase (APT) family kinase protein